MYIEEPSFQLGVLPSLKVTHAAFDANGSLRRIISSYSDFRTAGSNIRFVDSGSIIPFRADSGSIISFRAAGGSIIRFHVGGSASVEVSSVSASKKHDPFPCRWNHRPCSSICSTILIFFFQLGDLPSSKVTPHSMRMVPLCHNIFTIHALTFFHFDG